MSRSISFVIDASGHHPVITTEETIFNKYTCAHHGDIGARVFSLEIKDADTVASTGPICIQCLTNMLSCCRAEANFIKETSDE